MARDTRASAEAQNPQPFLAATRRSSSSRRRLRHASRRNQARRRRRNSRRRRSGACEHAGRSADTPARPRQPDRPAGRRTTRACRPRQPGRRLARRCATCRATSEQSGASTTRMAATQPFGPSIQFDTKGVEFGPWLRRFIAQVKRNWFVPQAAMSLRGHVVITFNIHKTARSRTLRSSSPSVGRIVQQRRVQRARHVESRPCRCRRSIPTDKAFFTVTFYLQRAAAVAVVLPTRVQQRRAADPPLVALTCLRAAGALCR